MTKNIKNYGWFGYFVEASICDKWGSIKKLNSKIVSSLEDAQILMNEWNPQFQQSQVYQQPQKEVDYGVRDYDLGDFDSTDEYIQKVKKINRYSGLNRGTQKNAGQMPIN
jgi:hypothetical protein